MTACTTHLHDHHTPLSSSSSPCSAASVLTPPPHAVATVTTTGMRGDELRRLQAALAAHRLHWEHELTTRTRVLIVRQGSAHSRKCAAVAAQQQQQQCDDATVRVVCVTPLWVTDGGCALSNTAAYALHPTLADADVCTTGLTASERGLVADVCARRGARLCATLTRRCALLITPDSTSSHEQQQQQQLLLLLPSQQSRHEHSRRDCSAKLLFAQQHKVPTLSLTTFVQQYDGRNSRRRCAVRDDGGACTVARTPWPVLTLSGVPAALKQTLTAAMHRVGLPGCVQDTLVLGMRHGSNDDDCHCHDDTSEGDDARRRGSGGGGGGCGARVYNTTHLLVPRDKVAVSRKAQSLLSHRRSCPCACSCGRGECGDHDKDDKHTHPVASATMHGACEIVDVAWLLHALRQRTWPDSAPFCLAHASTPMPASRANTQDDGSATLVAVTAHMTHNVSATTTQQPQRRCSSLEQLLSDLEEVHCAQPRSSNGDSHESSSRRSSSGSNNNGSGGGGNSAAVSLVVHVRATSDTLTSSASTSSAASMHAAQWPASGVVDTHRTRYDTHVHKDRTCGATEAAAAAAAVLCSHDDAACVAESQAVYYARPHATVTFTQQLPHNTCTRTNHHHSSSTSSSCGDDDDKKDDTHTKLPSTTTATTAGAAAAHAPFAMSSQAQQASSSSPSSRRAALLLANDVRRDVDVAALLRCVPSCTVVSSVDACTHLVTGRPSKTEPFLCCVAAGKWVVAPSFVHACLQAGAVVEATAHEWCTARARALGQRASVVALVQACPLQRLCTRRPFVHWRRGVELCCTSPARAASFARVLRCGGCDNVRTAASADDVLARLDATAGTHNDGADAGHTCAVLADVNTWSATQLQQYTTRTRGRHVLRIDYIVHCLCSSSTNSSSSNGDGGGVAVDDKNAAAYALTPSLQTSLSTLSTSTSRHRKRTRSAVVSPSRQLTG